MNTRIMASIMMIAVAASGLGYGTYAFFSDTETSTDNIFTAGSLDLTLDGTNGATATIASANFAPGDTTVGSILLRNEGSIRSGDAEGHTVDLDLRALVTVTDDAGNPDDPEDGGVSAVPISRYLVITTLTYDGVDLLAHVGDADSDGTANTLADLESAGVIADLADPGAAGKALEIAVLFSADAGNDLKRDVADVDFTFHLAQADAADLA